MDFWELFRSVEIVWITWFSCLILLGLLVRHLLLRLVQVDYRVVLARLQPRRIHSDTSGAAYSLSFVMVLPFLVLLIALIIETTFMLVAKIGTMQAAFASARTASVWTTRDRDFTSTDDFHLAKDKAHQAAVSAMVPYSSSFDTGELPNAVKNLEMAINKLREKAFNLPGFIKGLVTSFPKNPENIPEFIGNSLFGEIKNEIAESVNAINDLKTATGDLQVAIENLREAMSHLPAAAKYLVIYKLFELSSTNEPKLRWEYIIKKYIYAAMNVEVDLSYSSSTSNEDKWKKHVEAKVTYGYPFKIAPLGVALGAEKKGLTYVYKISSTARINNECPRNRDGKTSIRLNP